MNSISSCKRGTERPRVAAFLAAYVFIVMAAVVVVVAPVYVGTDPGYLTWLTFVFQWTPFLVVVLLHVLHRTRHRGESIGRGDWKLWSAAAVEVRGRGSLILRVCLLSLGALLVLSIVPLLLSAAMGFVYIRVADGAAIPVLLTLPVVVLLMIPVAGEELAWRGYLTTLLAPRGFAVTTALIGAVWAAWHVPLTMAFVVAGVSDTREVVAKTIDLLFAAVLLSALRYLSQSVWPAVFAHSLFNNLFQMVQSNFMGPISELSDAAYWGYMAISWAAWIVVDVLLVVAVMRRNRGVLADSAPALTKL